MLKIQLNLTPMIFNNRILIFLALLLVGCSPITQMAPPDVGVPQEKLNSHIHLLALYASNTFKTNEPIFIEISGTSKETILLPSDYGIRIFLQEDEHWIELENISTYFSDTLNYLYPNNNNPTNTMTAGMLPRLPDLTQKAHIRIYIIGNVVEGTIVTDQKVGAFIDITLTP